MQSINFNSVYALKGQAAQSKKNIPTNAHISRQACFQTVRQTDSLALPRTRSKLAQKKAVDIVSQRRLKAPQAYKAGSNTRTGFWRLKAFGARFGP